MRDICREARVTAPTIYYYFKNKEVLFDAVVRDTIGMEEFTRLLNVQCKRAKDLDSRIHAFAKTYLSSFPNRQINTGLYLRRSTKLDPVGARTLLRELTRIDEMLIRIIREGVKTKEFRSTNPRMAAECLLGMMNRFIFQRIHFHRNYRAEEAAAYLSDFFLKAMKAEREK